MSFDWLLLLLLSANCRCSSNLLARLQLVKTSFNEGREVGLTRNSPAGSLVQLVATEAVISSLSVMSSLRHGSCLVGCFGCDFSLENSNFEGLANRFGHFSGSKVEMQSVTFKRCIRPVTLVDVNQNCNGASQRGKRYVRTNGVGFSGQSCGFLYCETTGAGGGVSVTGGGNLYLDSCSFIGCKAGNGWGAGLYAQVKTVSDINHLTVGDMTAIYSVFHIEHSTRGSHFESIKLNGGQQEGFYNIHITAGSSASAEAIQGGGSGLVIFYTKSLTVENMKFKDCGFDTKNIEQKKRAGGIMVEGSNLNSVTLTSCSFTNVKGVTGCIHVSPLVTLTLDTVAIDGCGGSDTSHPYSIWVNAKAKPTIRKLTMKNMNGGNGRLWIGEKMRGVTDSYTLQNCGFENWQTGTLFSPIGSFSLSLTGCTFKTLIVDSSANLFEVNSGDGKLKGLTLTGCKWEGFESHWALIRASHGNVRMTGGCSFSTKLDAGQHPLYFTTGLSSLEISNLTVSGPSTNGNCFLFVEGSPTVTISKATFNSVTRSTGTDSPLVSIGGSAKLNKLQGCEFSQCTWRGAPLLLITVALPNDGIVGCTFRSCVVGQAALLEVSYKLKLTGNCVFQDLAPNMALLETAPIRINNINGPIEMSNVEFKGVRGDGRNLIYVVSGTQNGLTLSHVNFNEYCSFQSFLSQDVIGTVSISDCNFKASNRGAMFSLNSDDATFTNCIFTGYAAQVIDAKKGTLMLRGCQINTGGTGGEGTFVIGLAGSCTLDLQNCCFQESGQSRYIKGPNTVTVVADIPLCFDRAKAGSVDFGDGTQFDDLASKYKIFNCKDCENQPTVEPPPDPTGTFTPSDTFEVIPTSEPAETDEPTLTSTEEEDEPTLTSTEEEDVPSSGPVPVPTETGPGDDAAKKSGNKAGEIVGILFGILLLIAVILLIIWFVLRRRKERSDKSASDREMVEETVEETESTWSTVDIDVPDGPTETNPLFAHEVSTDLEFEERVWL